MSGDLSIIVEQMRSALAVSDPDLDTSVGTTTRKILDAVGESIAESYLDQHMLHYQYDVDSKTGGDLDTFTQAIGGITRLTGRRATGSVTFSVGPPSIRATQVISIPFGTQVRSRTDSSIIAATIVGAAIAPGENSVTVPVQVMTTGPTGNVAAGVLTQPLTQLDGVSLVSNLNSLTGGASQESDAELRARWKLTAFRSMAGTESLYLAQALNNENVTAAKVVGSNLTWFEQVQPTYATSGPYAGQLIAQSTNPDCAYAFTSGVMVGGAINDGYVLPYGTAYTLDTTVSPPVVIFNQNVTTYDTGTKGLDSTPIVSKIDGGILDLQYRYVPGSSRNDPDGSRFGDGSVMSRVDIMVAGSTPTAVTQSMTFSNSMVFSSNSASKLYTQNFERTDGSHPNTGSIFIPLQFGPIISVPEMLTIGTSTYGMVGANNSATYKNAYRVVHDVSAKGRAYNSLFGLEFSTSALPSNGASMVVGNNSTYVYNSTPRDVQSAIERWRLVGIDALVHGAIERQIRVSCAIMYQRTALREETNTAIQTALSNLFMKSGLGGVLQVSDVESAIHSVSGVDNVRLLSSGDYPGWSYSSRNNFATGLQVVAGGSVIKTYITSNGHLQDAVFRDNESPIFESLTTQVKAQNTFLAS